MKVVKGEQCRYRKPEQNSGDLSVISAHADKATVDNVSVSEHSNHSVPSRKQSFLVCMVAKYCEVHIKYLKDTYKKRMSRVAKVVTSLLLTANVSSTAYKMEQAR